MSIFTWPCNTNLKGTNFFNNYKPNEELMAYTLFLMVIPHRLDGPWTHDLTPHLVLQVEEMPFQLELIGG